MMLDARWKGKMSYKNLHNQAEIFGKKLNKFIQSVQPSHRGEK